MDQSPSRHLRRIWRWSLTPFSDQAWTVIRGPGSMWPDSSAMRSAKLRPFFNVHDGPSTQLAEQGIAVDAHIFNANHDIPPTRARNAVSQGQALIWRNGDYQLYAHLFQRLEELFISLRPLGILIPRSSQLLDRTEYLIFQIRTVAEICRQSNLIPGIGGAIPFLAISQGGIYTHGVRFV